MAKSRRKNEREADLRHFGTKRQKAALRAKRSTSHRARTKPNPPRKRKRSVAKRSAPKRRNPIPMQILAWGAGNPAKRSTKVARSRKKTKHRATAKRSNAGRRRTMKVTHHRRRRSNPGALGSPMNWVQGGAGVVAGVVGARAIPQMILGASNTGAMGYVANAVAAVGLGWLTHMVFPRNQVLVTSVIAGGFAGLISRIISDRTPFGSQFSLSGVGDWGLGLYQKSNYPYPPHLINGRGPNSSNFTWGDGSQTPAATLASGGSDSTGAC